MQWIHKYVYVYCIKMIEEKEGERSCSFDFEIVDAGNAEYVKKTWFLIKWVYFLRTIYAMYIVCITVLTYTKFISQSVTSWYLVYVYIYIYV